MNILFVCHGNICRSVMAEMIMRHLVSQRIATNHRLSTVIDSCATSREEIGNDIYPPAKRKLQEKGVDFSKHRAHQITPDEFSANDLIITMDSSNMRLLGRIVPNWESATPGENIPAGKIVGKVHMMMEFAEPQGASGKWGVPDVADPWYTGDFEQTYQDVMAGCRGLLELI